MVGDFVVLRSNGMPVYNFSVVVDDYFMRISHIVRGEDHLSNTPRQLMIYEAFGWAVPQFAHISMILGIDKKKLSKREGASSVNDYLNNGYLPEALINFISLQGWSPPDMKEIRPLSEIIQLFELEKLSKAPAVFDDEKLDWMNGEYIRAMEIKELAKRIHPFVVSAGLNPDLHGEDWFLQVLSTVRGNLRTLKEIGPHLEIYYGDRFGFEADAELHPERYVPLARLAARLVQRLPRPYIVEMGSGPGVLAAMLAKAHARLRAEVPFYEKDRYFAPDIAAATQLVNGGLNDLVPSSLLPSFR